MKHSTIFVLLTLGCGGGSGEPGTTTYGTTFVQNPAALCDPDFALLTPNPIEGDLVEVELRCASGNPFDDYVVTLEAAPNGDAAINGTLLTFSTGLDQAGEIEAFISFGHPETIGETLIINLDIADAWNAAGNVAPDPLEYTDEFGTEVLWLDLAGDPGVTPSAGTAYWKGDPYDVTVGFLNDEDAGNIKRNLLLTETGGLGIDFNERGVDDRSTLALYASANDPTRMRQRLSYEAWEALREPASDGWYAKCFFTTVYLNGAYHGLYTGCELHDDQLLIENDLPATTSAWAGLDEDANFRREDAAGDPKISLTAGMDPLLGGDSTQITAFVGHVADTDSPTFWATAGDWVQTAQVLDWAVFIEVAGLDKHVTTDSIWVYDPVLARHGVSLRNFDVSWGLDASGLAWPADTPIDHSRNQLLEHTWIGGKTSAENTLISLTSLAGTLGPTELHTTIADWDEELSAATPRDLEKWGSSEDYTAARDALETWIDDRMAYVLAN